MAKPRCIFSGIAAFEEGRLEYDVHAKFRRRGSDIVDGYTLKYGFKDCPKEGMHMSKPEDGSIPSHDYVKATLAKALRFKPVADAAPAPAPAAPRSLPPPPVVKMPSPVPSSRFRATQEPPFAESRAHFRDSSSDSEGSVEASPKKRHKTKQRRLEDEMAADSGGEVDESDSGDDTARALPGAAPAPAQPPTQGLVTALTHILASRIDAPPVAKARIRSGLELKQRLEAKEEKMASSEEESDSDDDVEDLTRTGIKRKKSSLKVSARSNISRDVAALKDALFIIGNGSKERTRLLFQRFGEDAFFDAWSDRTNDVIVENIRKVVMCEKLQHKGTRPLPEQHAIDAVAACVASSKAEKRRDQRAIARATGLRRATIARGAAERALIMERGIRARKREIRWDTRDYTALRDFCHLEEISRLDTNARHAVRVSLEDGTVEMHEPHTLMMTRGDVAKTWLKSDGYRLWQLSNVNPETGEPLEMSESRVLMNLCPCLRPPTWRECADPIKTGMRECVPGVLLMLY